MGFECRYAQRRAPNIMQEFAKEMWRKGGVRMVVLAGWKDERGEIFTTK